MYSVTLHVPKAAIERKAGQIKPAVQSGLRRVAGHVQQIAVRKAGEIYRRPVPTRAAVYAHRRGRGRTRRSTRAASNAPAWKRTGATLEAVKAEPRFEHHSVTLMADLPYAHRRHQLGVSWQPKAPALGIVRRNPFFAEAKQIVQPQLKALFEDGFSEEWNK